MEPDKNRQKPTLSPITGLTPQQEQAAIILASGESVTAVARQLKINRSTLYDWRRCAAFQYFYQEQCREMQEAARNSLLNLHDRAIKAIADLLANGSENTRLKASMWLLERVTKPDIRETMFIEELKRHYARLDMIDPFGDENDNYRLKGYEIDEEQPY